jgi:hypothetical protein
MSGKAVMLSMSALRVFLVRRRKALVVAGCCLAVAMLLWYTFLVLCWPAGLPARYLIGYWFMSIETRSVSPAGQTVHHVRLDAGAMSYGPGIAFVLHRHHWWERWQVLASGWAGYTGANESIVWTGDSTFRIEFSDHPRDRNWRIRTVTVP